MFQAFSHVMLYVADMERAVAFWTDVIGFQPDFVDVKHYAVLRHTDMGCRLDLHPTEADGKDVGFGPIPYFQVADVDATLVKLKERGVRTGESRREGNSPKFATFHDSEGNAIGLEEPYAS